MKEIKEIKVIFENLETCNISSDEIGFIGFNNIKEDISRIADNCIANLKVAENAFIEIIKDRPINDKDDYSYQSTSLFNRIKNFNDITSFEIHYKDGSEEDIYVKYEETPSFSNKLQHSTIEKNNHLYIVISKKYKSFRDYFGEDFDEYIAR